MHAWFCHLGHRHSIFCIVPPHLLHEIARRGSAAQRDTEPGPPFAPLTPWATSFGSRTEP
jgi:hypothetical protein